MRKKQVRKWRTPEYSSWEHMIQRCTNPNHDEYFRYGGRGISVCDEWRYSFKTFLEDMGNKPTKKHTIDRKDNDDDYMPGNCRWATRKEQALNRRDNHLLIYKGITLPRSLWCERLGLNANTIRWRLKAGWSVDQAFETPVWK